MEVQKITIVPRGMAGGYTAYTPKEDNITRYTKNEMIAIITSTLGGRAAEELFLALIHIYKQTLQSSFNFNK